MKHAIEQIATYVSRMSGIRWTDIVEIIILSFLIYHILVWIKNTKAWSLLKGILVIAVFILFAAYFEMNTILWIVNNLFSVAVTAVVVILQPELRRAVEELGRKNIISSIIPITVGRGPEGGRFSDKTINEIVKACVEMGRARTGALIVMEKDESLTDYERTGIEIDGVVTSQLLINIFEHNTPLHDGAVIVRGDRVTSATCYLPLSDNMRLSKELGTRHRAGVGISEVTDSLTIIVSEETGKISVAYGGDLERNVDSERLRARLSDLQNKSEEDSRKRIMWKGRWSK
ncbi:MAG: diadenylate cyclase CdaA [Lachnospiraceae bacterium]|nr:diadenylate cyclase CdaA [Lachnospiraceae bacterium]